jgi:hypothetical protein
MALEQRIRDNLKKNAKKLSVEERRSFKKMARFLTKTKHIQKLPSIKKYKELGIL